MCMWKCSQVVLLPQGTHSSGADPTASGPERATNLSPLSAVQEAGLGRSAECCRSTEEGGFVLSGNTKEGFDKGEKNSQPPNYWARELPVSLKKKKSH